MPTYEYACSKCGHEFEQFQSMKDEPLKKCPSCKKAGLKRLVGGGAGLIFKGSGFYITDYKKSSGGNGDGGGSKSAGSDASASKSSDKKTSETKSSSDSKPASPPAKAVSSSTK